jgi:uncharacterized membrane protein YsdA (DUF1294 family)
MVMRLVPVHLAVTGGLLLLPALAVQRRAVDLGWMLIYALVLSAVTYWAYAIDKERARKNRWRLAEGRLHLLELLGGWPGAYLAQRWLRHKSSKRSYQIVFWLIVLVYQLAAVDSLRNGQLSRTLLDAIK